MMYDFVAQTEKMNLFHASGRQTVLVSLSEMRRLRTSNGDSRFSYHDMIKIIFDLTLTHGMVDVFPRLDFAYYICH